MGLFKKRKPPPTVLKRFLRLAGSAYNVVEDAGFAGYDKLRALELEKKLQAVLQSMLSILQFCLDGMQRFVVYLWLCLMGMLQSIAEGFQRSVAYTTQVCQQAGITQTHVSVGVAGLFLVVAIQVARKRRQRRRHKQLYGDLVFPPQAPFTTLQTGAALNGSNNKLPKFFQRCVDKVGPIFRLPVPFLRSSPMVAVVGDLEVAKQILKDETTTRTEAMYAPLAAIAGHRPNILTSEGSIWKHSRKGISPAFAKQHVDRMHKVCKDKTEEWIEKKLTLAVHGGGSLDIAKEFLFLTLTIICKAAFEYSIKDREAKRLIRDFELVTREFAHEQAKRPFRRTFGFLVPSVRNARQARTRIHKFAKKLLDGHRKKPLHMRSSAETIIGRIDKNQSYQSDKYRIADMVMVLFSGLETTAYSLAWIFLELARNPKVSQKLHSALNGTDDVLAQGMLKNVLREGMRFNPVYPGVGIRTLGRDFFLPEQNMVIPRGSLVLFPSMILTRYGVPDANEFNPDRWNEHPDKSFLLFSAGNHKCMGQGLALAEITWVMSRLCAEYEFSVKDEGTPTYSLFWKCQGAKLRVRRVSRQRPQEQLQEESAQ